MNNSVLKHPTDMLTKTERDKVAESPGVRTKWRAFYDCERELFAMYENPSVHGIEILAQHKDYKPVYETVQSDVDNKMVLRPPRYIRTISYLTGKAHENVKAIVDEMRDHYTNAMVAEGKYTLNKKGDPVVKLPARFPEIIKNVASIKIATYAAHASTSITTKEDVAFTKSSYAQWDGLKEQGLEIMWQSVMNDFESCGINTYIKDNALMISSSDLLKYAGATQMQMRRETGTSFECSIKKLDQEKPMRRAYGFLMFDNKVPILQQVYREVKVKQMSAKADEITFSFIPSNISFWVITKK